MIRKRVESFENFQILMPKSTETVTLRYLWNLSFCFLAFCRARSFPSSPDPSESFGTYFTYLRTTSISRRVSEGMRVTKKGKRRAFGAPCSLVVSLSNPKTKIIITDIRWAFTQRAHLMLISLPAIIVNSASGEPIWFAIIINQN